MGRALQRTAAEPWTRGTMATTRVREPRPAEGEALAGSTFLEKLNSSSLPDR